MQEDDPRRARVKALAEAALAAGEPTAWFETLYREAGTDLGAVPWAEGRIHPLFEEWLARGAGLAGGGKALVVGCGLGDDAEVLAGMGFRVTAFDVSPTAIGWCRRRFPGSAVEYGVEDLFALPWAFAAGFDFVLEIHTVQALPVTVRDRAVAAIAATVAPGGRLLVGCRGRDEDEPPVGPPWALTRVELDGFARHGLMPREVEDFLDREDPPKRRFRALFVRPGAGARP
jgi:SAM-dependent methyltransferase